MCRRSHTWEARRICHSETDFFHSVWLSLLLSVFLQTTECQSSLWVQTKFIVGAKHSFLAHLFINGNLDWFLHQVVVDRAVRAPSPTTLQDMFLLALLMITIADLTGIWQNLWVCSNLLSKNEHPTPPHPPTAPADWHLHFQALRIGCSLGQVFCWLGDLTFSSLKLWVLGGVF